MAIINSKLIHFLLLLSITLSYNAKASNKMDFFKVIFHSTRCNGACPSIALEIDSSGNVYVNRTYYKTKSEVDLPYSGKFKGRLAADKYQQLLEALKACDFDTLSSREIKYMDISVKMLIVYYNGKRKYLKWTGNPILGTENLINILLYWAHNKELDRTNEKRQLEYKDE